MDKIFIALGGLSALTGVAMGAFGAHGLRDRLSEQMLSVFQTGAQYHLTHALGLLMTGILLHLFPGSIYLKIAGWLLFAGIILFSGSLYLISIFEIRKMGMITPVGGLMFIIAWMCIAVGIFKS